ncbi:ABC transporter permease [Endozoicomonas sp. SM1973]|uniref:Cell division protein FtsX n=1 Tax=Spartinivicinus marinus TaxID=2994442 RepID=A0A853HSZ2_9GAMM|nr:permease-like cell division protein FtsX [Spartinivicinus marinus]MCX4026576.1 permease-like cell division protein FtsX [Spartinivicinus marinus]NYZ64413.1 ABC transporter permease [Spartinivicinus marinus]
MNSINDLPRHRTDAIKANQDPARPANKAAKVAHPLIQLFLHHQLSMWDALKRLLKAPISTVFTWLMIALALALPAAMYIGLANVKTLGERWDGAPQLSVFLQRNVKQEQLTALTSKIKEAQIVEQITTITPEQALSQLENTGGFKGVARFLPNNPLPTVLVVKFSGQFESSDIQLLVAEWRLLPGIDVIQYDLAWVDKLNKMTAIASQFSILIAAGLALAVMLVIGNTVKLSIESRRAEIMVVKLIGATNGYVRRPFLYLGFWFGVGGGLLALILLQGLIGSLAAPVAELSTLYESDFKVMGLGLSDSLVLLGVSACLGCGGAWLICWHYLREIEPR